MWQRRTPIALVALVALVGIAWWAFQRFGTEAYLDISQDELQQRLSAKFPIKNCLLACLELAEPAISLTEGSDRVAFSTKVLVTVGQRQMPGRVAFSGKVRYVRYEGDFYFDQIEIQDFQLSGFPPEFAELVRVRGPGIARAALSSYPIYSIKGNTAKASLAKLALRDVKVVNGKLRITFLSVGG